jgi:hypothetical protein
VIVNNTVKYNPVRAEGVDFDSVYSFNNRRSSQHIRNMGSVFLKKVKEQMAVPKNYEVLRKLAKHMVLNKYRSKDHIQTVYQRNYMHIQQDHIHKLTEYLIQSPQKDVGFHFAIF